MKAGPTLVIMSLVVQRIGSLSGWLMILTLKTMGQERRILDTPKTTKELALHPLLVASPVGSLLFWRLPT